MNLQKLVNYRMCIKAAQSSTLLRISVDKARNSFIAIIIHPTSQLLTTFQCLVTLASSEMKYLKEESADCCQNLVVSVWLTNTCILKTATTLLANENC